MERKQEEFQMEMDTLGELPETQQRFRKL